MTNKKATSNLFAQLVKTVSDFCGSLFASGSAREFQRLKNFIAS